MKFIRHRLVNCRSRVASRYVNSVPRLFSNGPPFGNHKTMSFTVGITRVLQMLCLLDGCGC